eukprot:2659540-Pyramimonas_sp.AAC.1
MGLLIHLSPRVLETGGFCSELFESGVGVLPGCAQSMPWTKAYLYQMLDDIHRRFFPVVVTQGYVDDLSQNAQGSADDVVSAVVPAALHLARGVDRLRLTMSDKSAIVSSKRSVSFRIARQLRAAGVALRVQDTVRDLGVATTAGKARCSTILKVRRAKAQRKAKKIKYLTGICKGASKLYKPGVLSVSSWGHNVLGLSPHQVRSVRAQAAKCSGWWSPGSCTTTLLSILKAESSDPAYRLRREQLLGFQQLWLGLDPRAKMRISRLWEARADEYACLPPGRIWRRVR